MIIMLKKLGLLHDYQDYHVFFFLIPMKDI